MLTKEQKQILINIILVTKFTPQEWEQIIRPIVMELQKEEIKEDGITEDNPEPKKRGNRILETC